jgi:hypothetical protein
MQEAFTVLTRAIREANYRLRQAEVEGDKSKHKLPTIRHAIKSLEEAYALLQWCHQQKLVLIRLWNLIEERDRANVQEVRDNSLPGRGTTRDNRGHRRSK